MPAIALPTNVVDDKAITPVTTKPSTLIIWPLVESDIGNESIKIAVTKKTQLANVACLHQELSSPAILALLNKIFLSEASAATPTINTNKEGSHEPITVNIVFSIWEIYTPKTAFSSIIYFFIYGAFKPMKLLWDRQQASAEIVQRRHLRSTASKKGAWHLLD